MFVNKCELAIALGILTFCLILVDNSVISVTINEESYVAGKVNNNNNNNKQTFSSASSSSSSFSSSSKHNDKFVKKEYINKEVVFGQEDEDDDDSAAAAVSKQTSAEHRIVPNKPFLENVNEFGDNFLQAPSSVTHNERQQRTDNYNKQHKLNELKSFHRQASLQKNLQNDKFDFDYDAMLGKHFKWANENKNKDAEWSELLDALASAEDDYEEITEKDLAALLKSFGGQDQQQQHKPVKSSNVLVNAKESGMEEKEYNRQFMHKKHPSSIQ